MFQINPWNATVCDHICEGKRGAKARPPTMKVSYTPPFHLLIPLPVPQSSNQVTTAFLEMNPWEGNPCSNWGFANKCLFDLLCGSHFFFSLSIPKLKEQWKSISKPLTHLWPIAGCQSKTHLVLWNRWGEDMSNYWETKCWIGKDRWKSSDS